MNALHETSWQYIAPVYWGGDELDAHSVVNNGTCFFLRIGQKLFGVTAHHVIAQYLSWTLSKNTQPHRLAWM